MKSKTKAGKRVFAAEIVGAAANGDHLECIITWKTGKATLVGMKDNSNPVPIVATTGNGRIEVSWESADTGSHDVECDLQFPGSSRKNLKFVGRKGTSGPYDDLDSSPEEDDSWLGAGTIA